jgi:hypothetical protein
MGGFVSMAAFRTHHAEAVLSAARGFFTSRGCMTEPIGPRQVGDDELQVFPPVDGWVAVWWPYRSTADAVTQAISASLDCLASDVTVYDGDFWNHTLLRAGETLDQFCSVPDYFTDDPAEVAGLVDRYAGNPQIVAAAVGRAVEDIAPYLVRTILNDDEEVVSPTGKAFPDDQSDLADPDVIYDFWPRLGVKYPADEKNGIGGLRLLGDWRQALVTST